jgi:hypothetical protein
MAVSVAITFSQRFFSLFQAREGVEQVPTHRPFEAAKIAAVPGGSFSKMFPARPSISGQSLPSKNRTSKRAKTGVAGHAVHLALLGGVLLIEGFDVQR